MLKIGLLGTGFMGQTHAEVYKILCLSMDIEVAGICDLNSDYAGRVSKMLGAKIYPSAETMIADPTLDVIDICLPTYLHYAYAKMAMEAGKDVFIEKPVVLSPKEGKDLIALQKQHGSRIMVGQCLRLWPAYIRLKEFYDEKKYGMLKSLSMKRLSQKPTWGFENWYMDLKKSGGVILDLHIHDLDYMRYLLGEPEDLHIHGDHDHLFTVFDYPNQLTVAIESGWDFPKAFPVTAAFQARFERATVCFQNGDLFVYEESGKQIQLFEEEHIDDSIGDRMNSQAADLGGYYNELKYFYECLLQNKEIEIAPLSEGVKTIELIHQEIKRGGLAY